MDVFEKFLPGEAIWLAQKTIEPFYIDAPQSYQWRGCISSSGNQDVRALKNQS
jgi:hypothetical protein